MKKRFVYISPICDILIFNTEAPIAVSGGGYNGFHNDGSGEEDEEW